MKRIQKTVAAWAAKIVGSAGRPTPRNQTSGPRPLDDNQLRQVAGGEGNTPQAPKGNW